MSARNQWDRQTCVNLQVDPVVCGWWITSIPLGKSHFQITSFQTHNMFGHSILTMLQSLKCAKYLIKFWNLTWNSWFLFATVSTYYSLYSTFHWMVTFLGRDLAVQVQEHAKTLWKCLKDSGWGQVFSAYGLVRGKVHGSVHTPTVALWAQVLYVPQIAITSAH